MFGGLLDPAVLPGDRQVLVREELETQLEPVAHLDQFGNRITDDRKDRRVKVAP